MNTVPYDYREKKYYLIEHYYNNYKRASARLFKNSNTRDVNRLKSSHVFRFLGRLLNKRAAVS